MASDRDRLSEPRVVTRRRRHRYLRQTGAAWAQDRDHPVPVQVGEWDPEQRAVAGAKSQPRVCRKDPRHRAEQLFRTLKRCDGPGRCRELGSRACRTQWLMSCVRPCSRIG